MVNEKLRSAAIAALAEYMGIAAEFVVDDAFVEVEKNAALNKDARLRDMYFFVCLGKQIPPSVPYAVLKQAIVRASGVKA